MIVKEYSMTLDTKRGVMESPIVLVMGDTGNLFHLRIQDDGNDIDLSDARVMAMFRGPAGSYDQHDLLVDGATVSFQLDKQAVSEGTNSCDVQIYTGEDGETLSTSATFTFEVRAATVGEDTIRQDTSLPILVDLIKKVHQLEEDFPAIAVTEIPGGHRITITNYEAEVVTCDVMDGVSGVYVGSGDMPEKYNVPIHVGKNETVVFNAGGYLASVAMIATCDSEGGNIHAAVMSDGGDVKEYRYTADADCYVLLSYLKAKTHELRIGTKSYFDGLSARIDELAGNIEFEVVTEKTLCTTGIDSYYVNSIGAVRPHSSYSMRTDIELKAGQRLYFNAQGEGTSIALLSIHDGDTYTPVIISSDNAEHDYEYFTDRDVTVTISSKKATAVYRKIVTSRILSDEARVTELTGDTVVVAKTACEIEKDGYYVNISGLERPSANYAIREDIALKAGQRLYGNAIGETKLGVWDTTSPNYVSREDNVCTFDLTNDISGAFAGVPRYGYCWGRNIPGGASYSVTFINNENPLTTSKRATLYVITNERQSTLSFDACGGSGAPAAVTGEGPDGVCTLTVPAGVPTKAGKKFSGWATEWLGPAVYQPGDSITVDDDTTLYASWGDLYVSLVYEAGTGGTGSFDVLGMPGFQMTVVDTGAHLKKPGKMISGYADTDGGAKAYDFGDRITLGNEDKHIYAVWVTAVYTIRYNAQGGTGAPETQTKGPGETLTLSEAVPIRVGKRFLGWATVPGGDPVYQPGDDYTADESCELCAVWGNEEKDFRLWTREGKKVAQAWVMTEDGMKYCDVWVMTENGLRYGR